MVLSLAKYEPSVLTLKVMAKVKLNTSIVSLVGITACNIAPGFKESMKGNSDGALFRW